MPCATCEYYFKNTPCEHRKIDFYEPIDSAPYDAVSLDFLTKKYNMLEEYCPCTTCLVKPMCQDPCDAFNSLTKMDK